MDATKRERITRALDQLMKDSDELDRNFSNEELRERFRAKLVIALMKTVTHEEAAYSLLKLVGGIMGTLSLSATGQTERAGAAFMKLVEEAKEALGDADTLLEKMYER